MDSKEQSRFLLLCVLLASCQIGGDDDMVPPDGETWDESTVAEEDGSSEDLATEDAGIDCGEFDGAVGLAVESIPPEGRLVAIGTRFTYDFSSALDEGTELMCGATTGTFEACGSRTASWLAPLTRGDATLQFTFIAGGCSVLRELPVRIRTVDEAQTIAEACVRFVSPESPDVRYVRGDAVTMDEGLVVVLCTTGDVAAQDWLFIRMTLRNIGDVPVDLQIEVCPNCEVTVWVEPPAAPGDHPTDDMLSCPCGILCDPPPAPGARQLATGEYLPALTFSGKFGMPERSCGTQFLQGPGELTVLGQYHGRRPDGTPLTSEILSVPLTVTPR